MAKHVSVLDFRKNVCYRAIQAIQGKSLGETWASEHTSISPTVIDDDHQDQITIYYADPTDKPKKRFFGLKTEPARRRLICVIWFDNPARKAQPNSWIVEAYGAEHLPLVEELTKSLSDKMNANATIILKDEAVRHETLWEDYANY